MATTAAPFQRIVSVSSMETRVSYLLIYVWQLQVAVSSQDVTMPVGLNEPDSKITRNLLSKDIDLAAFHLTHRSSVSPSRSTSVTAKLVR